MKKAAAEIEIRRYGDQAASHAHDHHQLVLPLAGALEMEVAGQGGRVVGLRAAAIPGGEAHSFLGTDENAFLIVDISNSDSSLPLFGGRRFWEIAAERPFFDFDPEMAGHLAFVASAVRAAPITGMRATVASEMILDGLARRAGLERPRLPEQVSKAVRLIETCASAPLSVADIARAAGLSSSRLHARFRSATGMSPMRYLAMERLRRAAFLLETTDFQVAQIAREAGYSDQSAFTRAFRRETGHTPQKYRDRRREKELRHKIR